MAIKKSALAMALERDKKNNAARVMKGVSTLRKNAKALEGAYGRAAAVRAEDFFTVAQHRLDGPSVGKRTQRAAELAEKYIDARQARRKKHSMLR